MNTVIINKINVLIQVFVTLQLWCGRCCSLQFLTKLIIVLDVNDFLGIETRIKYLNDDKPLKRACFTLQGFGFCSQHLTALNGEQDLFNMQ